MHACTLTRTHAHTHACALSHIHGEGPNTTQAKQTLEDQMSDAVTGHEQQTALQEMPSPEGEAAWPPSPTASSPTRTRFKSSFMGSAARMRFNQQAAALQPRAPQPAIPRTTACNLVCCALVATGSSPSVQTPYIGHR